MNDNIKTLKVALSEWQDWDGAAHALALCLGLMDVGTSFAEKAKPIFWTNNGISMFLYDMLEVLVNLGVLELRTRPEVQYRWNQDFKGSWE